MGESSTEATKPTFDDLQGLISADTGARGWLRSRPTSSRLGIALTLSMALPSLVVVLSARVDLGLVPHARILLETLLLGAAVVVALWIAFRPLHRPALPAGVVVGSVVFALAVALGLSALSPAHHAHAESLLGVGTDFVPRARACFLAGAVWSIPLILGLGLLSRGAVPATAVVAGGLVGMLALQLHCPLVSQTHILAGHVTVVVSGVLGAIAIVAWQRR